MNAYVEKWEGGASSREQVRTTLTEAKARVTELKSQLAVAEADVLAENQALADLASASSRFFCHFRCEASVFVVSFNSQPVGQDVPRHMDFGMNKFSLCQRYCIT